MPREKHIVAKNSAHTPSEMFVFVGGGADDPLPLASEASKRFGHDITHNRIVWFSGSLLKWTYDDGSFHTGCTIEIPKEWLPNPIANQEALAKVRKTPSVEGLF